MQIKSIFKELGVSVRRNKSEILFSQGETSSSLFYIETGLAKAIYITSDGREMIKSFVQEGDMIGSFRSCVLGEPSAFALICLEDCAFIQFDFQKFMEYTKSNLDLSQHVISFLTTLAMKKEQREYEFLCLNAEERLDAFQKRQPDLIQRIKQQDLARYLGITPVALSRIRAQKMHK